MVLAVFFNLFIGFIASAAYAVILNVPKDSIVTGGAIGALGWVGYWSINRYNGSVFIASVACSVILAVLSRVAAVQKCKPVTVFFVPGLIPVVPGISFFHAIQALINKLYRQAAGTFLDVLYTLIGIICGLAIAATMSKIYYGVKGWIKRDSVKG